LNLYAESSAVLSWLLDDQYAGPVREALSNSEIVLASDLTIVECHRVLVETFIQGVSQKLLQRNAQLNSATSQRIGG
jgi:uncharacterized protein with PIN domain